MTIAEHEQFLKAATSIKLADRMVCLLCGIIVGMFGMLALFTWCHP